MLTRLYIDNFRSLVNFELKFDRINLLMGSNGSGKSAVFDVLRKIQLLVKGEFRLSEIFSYRDMTRWQSAEEMLFEISLCLNQDDYTYKVVVLFTGEKKDVTVKEESLHINGKPAYLVQNGSISVFNESFERLDKYGFELRLSGIGLYSFIPVNKYIEKFTNALAKMVIVSISPAHIEMESRKEAVQLSCRMENFISWYRKTSQENMEVIPILFDTLRKVLPGFRSFSLKGAPLIMNQK